MESEIHRGSLFNQKYFEGYRRAITMDDSGKMRVEFVYEGTYYTRTIRENFLHKLGFILVPLISIAGMIGIMTVRTPMNYSKSVIFFQVLMLFLLFLDLICGVVRCLAKEKLTRWEYRMASLSVKEISIVNALVSVGLFAASWVRVFGGKDTLRAVNGGMIVYALTAVFQVLLMMAAVRETYQETESEDLTEGIDVTEEVSPMGNPDKGYWR